MGYIFYPKVTDYLEFYSILDYSFQLLINKCLELFFNFKLYSLSKENKLSLIKNILLLLNLFSHPGDYKDLDIIDNLKFIKENKAVEKKQSNLDLNKPKEPVENVETTQIDDNMKSEIDNFFKNLPVPRRPLKYNFEETLAEKSHYRIFFEKYGDVLNEDQKTIYRKALKKLKDYSNRTLK